MPVYIYSPDAFDKMVEVEGEEYREFKSIEAFDVCSFDAFLEAWREMDASDPAHKEISPPWTIRAIIGQRDNVSIYGLWGWSRYLVYNSGEIAFIREFWNDGVAKARQAGFRIFPDDFTE